MTNVRLETVLWHNLVNFKSKILSASPSRKFRVKRCYFGPVVMLFPVKPWSIASLARRTFKRFFGWSKMRFFCSTRVKSSLVGSVRTESLRMSPSSSDRGSSFTINSSRLMGAFIFLYFVPPRSFLGDFSFSWRGMKLYYAS